VKADRGLTIKRMVKLAGISRASFYRSDCAPASASKCDMELRDAIQKIALEGPPMDAPGSQPSCAAKGSS